MTTQTEFWTKTKRYPSAPGHRDRDTSRAAASAMSASAGNIRDRCLDVLRAQALTADEVATAMELSVLTVRPRITELALLGKIEDAGIRRANVSGKKAIVWRVV